MTNAYHYLRERSTGFTGGKALTLHAANPGSVPGTTNGSSELLQMGPNNCPLF